MADVKKKISFPGVTQLNYDIDEEHLIDGALHIIKNVRPAWKEKDMVFKVFTDGISNKLIGCRLRDDSVQDDSVLVRVYGANTEEIIDRDMEMLAMYILNNARCSKPLYCQFNNGMSYGFVPGACLTVGSCRDPDIGKLVAEEMVRLSGIDPVKYSEGLLTEGLAILNSMTQRLPCTFTKMRTFMAAAPESFPNPEQNARFRATIPTLEDLKNEMNDLEKELRELGSPVVFSHNDILLNNIVYNKGDGRCYFIDFEYASFNYQAFDIGNHFCEWAGVDEVDYSRYPDKPTQLVWLTHYLEAYKTQQGHADTTPTETELQTLYVQVNKFSLAANLFWGIWALVQARFSTIDFDFLGYSKIRLDQYFKTKPLFMELQLP